MSTISSAAMFAALLFLLLMAYAGIMDLLTLKIRNKLVLAVAALWLVAAPLAGLTLAEMGMSVLVAALVFLVTFALFAAGWIGAGDAKLASAAALWFGWHDALAYFFLASLCGGALSLAIVFLRAKWPPLPPNWPQWLRRLQDARTGVPYGVAFALSALLLFHRTDLFSRLA
ncbi:A24 family peptidase [Afifella pfennigii]|uniref:A24 family peptidase n=1 Tax=Afifella pfennigii TaxID=209897 RepID=UPI0005509477|nr:prepilin peptidase [Afifella pfennigii]